MRTVTVFFVTVIEVITSFRINSRSKSNFSILIRMYPLCGIGSHLSPKWANRLKGSLLCRQLPLP